MDFYDGFASLWRVHRGPRWCMLHVGIEAWERLGMTQTGHLKSDGTGTTMKMTKYHEYYTCIMYICNNRYKKFGTPKYVDLVIRGVYH